MTDISLRYLLFGEDRSASSTITSTGVKAQKTSSIVKHAFAGMGSAIGGPIGEAVDHVESMFSSLSGSSATMGEKMMGAGVGVAGLGAGLSVLGSKEKEATNALQAAIGATGKSYDTYKGKIEEVIKEQENYNHSASDTSNALATLTQATKDPQAAIDKMGLVANLAAAQHISLGSAATAVGKAYNGSTKIFKTYGIQVLSVSSATAALHKAQDTAALATKASTVAHQQLAHVQHEVAIGAISGKNATDALAAAQANVTSVDGKAITAHDNLTKAQRGMKAATDTTKAGFEQLSQRLDGQASASVDSFSGHLRVLETKVHDEVSMLGQKFGPALQAAGVALGVVGTITQIVANRKIVATAATEALTVAQAEESVVTDETAVSTGILGAAMDALPIFALIAGIALLVGGIIIAYKHSETFRAIVQGALHAVGAAGAWLGGEFVKLWHVATTAFSAVTGAVATSYAWVKSHWPLILAILTGPIGLAVLFVVSHWKQITATFDASVAYIKAKAVGMWDGVTHAFSSATSAVTGLWGKFEGFLATLPGRVSSKVSNMFGGFTAAFRGAINWIIDKWNGLAFTMPSVNTHIPGVGTVGGFSIGTPDIPRLAAGGTLLAGGGVLVGEHGAEHLTLPAGASVRPLSAAERAGGGGDGTIANLTVVLKSASGREMQRELLQLKRQNGNLVLGLA